MSKNDFHDMPTKRVLLITDSLDFTAVVQLYCKCMLGHEASIRAGYCVEPTFREYTRGSLGEIFREEQNDRRKNYDGIFFAPLFASKEGHYLNICEDHKTILSVFGGVPVIVAHDFFEYMGEFPLKVSNIFEILELQGADEVIGVPLDLKELFWGAADGPLGFHRFWRQDNPDTPNSRALTL